MPVSGVLASMRPARCEAKALCVLPERDGDTMGSMSSGWSLGFSPFAAWDLGQIPSVNAKGGREEPRPLCCAGRWLRGISREGVNGVAGLCQRLCQAPGRSGREGVKGSGGSLPSSHFLRGGGLLLGSQRAPCPRSEPELCLSIVLLCAGLLAGALRGMGSPGHR